MANPNIDDCELVEEVDVEPSLDDGYSIALYKTKDGRYFIYIRHSDFSSRFEGALGFYQWVPEGQLSDWKDL